MSDPVVEALEARGLTNIHAERAPDGHLTSLRATPSNGQEITILMDEPHEDHQWIDAVLARADPEAFMAEIIARREGATY